MKFLVLSAMLIGSIALTGCSVDGQITDVTKRWKKPDLAQSVGLTSAAQQNYKSPEGYRVASSLGAFHTGVETEVQGYKVYSSLQGNIVAETMIEGVE